ncbi:MAG: MliC family protein [Candidatus Pacebacteria bacterium]|nr:MliC family protein [Candidatus Paceibacterota bacterium]
MMKTHNKFVSLLAITLVLLGAYFLFKNTKQDLNQKEVVHFFCTNGSMDAYFGTETLKLVLSDGRSFDLDQVMSGSGIRYEKDNVVFIGKGSDAMLQEGGATTYENCVANSSNDTDVNGISKFTDQGKTISFSYPSNLHISGGDIGYTPSWRTNTQSLGIVLAKLVIPKEFQPNTNFSEATFSVGTSSDPEEVKNCLVPRNGEREKGTLDINGLIYTKITLSEGAAGNYYDTTSYRIVRNSQCYAVEHTIHSTNFANYPKDSGIKEFDTQAVVSVLDSMVKSFTLFNEKVVSSTKDITSVTALELVEDSRCPKSVQCIWAGTVKVKVQVTNNYGKNNRGTLTLDEKQDIGGVKVTLTEVLPEKTQETIPFSKYKFTFVTE